MKKITLFLILFLSRGTAFAWQELSTEQLKSELIGKTMGGREKGWKFQSVEQIKELTIRDMKEEANKLIYTITLKLQDPRVSDVYAAEAEVTCEKVGSDWKVKLVGLKSMKKVER